MSRKCRGFLKVPADTCTLVKMMWDVDAWNGLRSQAKNPQQPFVTAQGAFERAATARIGWAGLNSALHR